MFKLHLIQAEHGDCFLLEARNQADRTFVLVDGGPTGTYTNHLRGKLNHIPGDRLDLVVLSHVDTDHIVGLQDLVGNLREQRAPPGSKELVEIAEFWMNRFEHTLDPSGDIIPRLRSMVVAASVAGLDMDHTSPLLAGIQEGNSLQAQTSAHGVPINERFQEGLVSIQTAPDQFSVGLISFRIVSPTKENLEELREDWLQWLDRFDDRMDQPGVAANADGSIPNMSSIAFLAQAEGVSVLMTGDARGDHIEEGLRECGLLNADGTLHVDVLKLQHHGSNRNVTKGFFKRITADTYVISANGKHDNPDLSTLKWLVDAAHEQGREIEIILTNRTESTREIRQIRRPSDFGYMLKVLKSGAHSKILTLA